MFARRAYNGAGGHLSDLAAAVRAAGIRHVSGRVFGDESMFDSVRTGPFWKPSYWQDCPPISALSVNKSLISFFKPYAYQQPAAARRRRLPRGAQAPRRAWSATTPARARCRPPLWSWRREPSPRISRLVLLMNRPSDNFFAEVLNKRVAVAAGHAGTMDNGRREARRYLESLGIDMTGSHMYDGSGLSPADRLSPRQILAVLRRA